METHPFVGGENGVADDQVVFFEARDQHGKGSHHQHRQQRSPRHRKRQERVGATGKFHADQPPDDEQPKHWRKKNNGGRKTMEEEAKVDEREDFQGEEHNPEDTQKKPRRNPEETGYIQKNRSKIYSNKKSNQSRTKVEQANHNPYPHRSRCAMLGANKNSSTPTPPPPPAPTERNNATTTGRCRRPKNTRSPQ